MAWQGRCPSRWMISSICWISSRALERSARMISSTSRRLPRKTCGLFDTGFAGGALDVTSMDTGVLTAVDQSLLSLEDFQPLDPTIPKEGVEATQHTNAVVEKSDVSVTVPMDWPTDLLDPLGGLDDPLGDDSLDAFVNLDTLLMGDTFFDECEPSVAEDIGLAELKPVIDFSHCDEAAKPDSPKAISTSKPSRKRKAGKAKVEAVKTSMFEIPESPADHDYTVKTEKMSPLEEVISPQTATTSGIATGKAKEDKQAVRRMKNNVASKRSREQRKAKFAEMDAEADYLTEENERLRKHIVDLEKKAQEMKALLVAKMAGKA